MIYKEVELPLDHPIIPELDKMREWIKSTPKFISGRLNDKDLSSEQLQRLKDGASGNCYHMRFDYEEGFDYSKIEAYSKQIYEEQTGIKDYYFGRVAKTWYPKGGYLGWHIDNDGGRFYASWAEGESFFRYQDPFTKEIVTSWDKPKQWTFRMFTFDKENPLWHCVGAEDLRISAGYRFVS